MKVERAGIIPYVVEEDDIQMMFMIPSDPEFGGPHPQCAKGQIEPGDSVAETALKEGEEELGLYKGNIDSMWKLGEFVGIHMFVCNIKDKDMFGDPHYETKETLWLTHDEFMSKGRDIHKPIVKAAMRSIKKRL